MTKCFANAVLFYRFWLVKGMVFAEKLAENPMASSHFKSLASTGSATSALSFFKHLDGFRARGRAKHPSGFAFLFGRGSVMDRKGT